MRSTVLLEGPSGTGKTTALRTIVPHVEKLFVLSTETGFEQVFFKKDPSLGPVPDKAKVHWKFLPPARPSWGDMKKAAQLINTLNVDALQKMQAGINKSAFQQFLEMIDVLGGFTCDCCNNNWGPADEWPESNAFALDGLTGISTMSMDLAVGAKPVKTQPDWGVAMDNLERFVSKCVFDTRCTFILLSHVDRERDEVTGGTWITTKTLGVKLAPKLVAMFDEVILAKRNGRDFVWSTAEPNADLKGRVLPLSDKITPDFGQLFK